MSTVYSLSAKGIEARQSARSSLPGELRQLLHLVDGRRTRGELIGSLQKSALTAGGLRWLEASGYIEPVKLPADGMQPAPAPAFTPASAPASVPASASAPASIPVSAPRMQAPQSAPAQPRTNGGEPNSARALLRAALAQHMLAASERWFGAKGAAQRRLIEGAERVEQLLQYLNPLTDAIAAQAGAQAGAEFAEDAAAILERRRR